MFNVSYSHLLFLSCFVDHPALHVLTHSFPTLRSSYLMPGGAGDLRCRLRRLERFERFPQQCFGIARSLLVRRTNEQHHFTLGRVERIVRGKLRSEEHTSELQSLRRISYAVFCLKKTKHIYSNKQNYITMNTHKT